MATLEAVFEAAMSLPLDQRAALAERLRDTLAGGSTMSAELREEFDRRWAEHEANPDDVMTWDEVKAAALARLKR